MWFALFLVVSLTVWWIEGPVSLTLIGGFVTLAAWPEVAWAVSALIALGCIASLAGWLDRPREWLVELTPTRAFD